MGDPCVLIASCSDIKPKYIAKQILKVDDLPAGKNLVENIFAHDWEIENKYYSAKVALCTTEARTFGDANFADSVQAFVLHFDTTQCSSFEQVKCWLPYLKQLEPAVLMLVCNTCSDTDAVDRLTAQRFCIEHGFELVELQPEETSDSEEDDFKETTGIERIIQALHAHTWPNLILKDKPNFRSAYIHQLMQDELKAKVDGNSVGLSALDDKFQDFVSCETGKGTCTSLANDSQTSKTSDAYEQRTGSNADCCSSVDSVNETSKNTCSGATADGEKESITTSTCKAGEKQSQDLTSEQRIDSLLGMDDMSMFAALGKEDPEGESFEELFEKLRVMKERADGLPLEERKAYAEKVAISFWKVIGGDEEEIDGLAESDSD